MLPLVHPLTRRNSKILFKVISILGIFCVGLFFGCFLGKSVIIVSSSVPQPVSSEFSAQFKAPSFINDGSPPLAEGDAASRLVDGKGGAGRSREGQSYSTTSSPLFIMILGSIRHPEKRKMIRETWLTLATGRKVQHIFLLGAQDLSNLERNNLKNEQEKFGDLLLMPDIHDSYSVLTKKVITGFKFAASNSDAEFVLKVEDDSFVQLDKLVDELVEREEKEKIYWGYFSGGGPTMKKGPWAKHQWFMCDKYVPYAVGGGYVLSMDLVQYISNNSHLLTLYGSEDVSVGTWLSPLDIKRSHDTRFDTWYKSRGCNNNYLVTHKQTPSNMMEKFNALETLGYLCKKEKFTAGYVYNWTLPPSQCCHVFEQVTLMR